MVQTPRTTKWPEPVWTDLARDEYGMSLDKYSELSLCAPRGSAARVKTGIFEYLDTCRPLKGLEHANPLQVY